MYIHGTAIETGSSLFPPDQPTNQPTQHAPGSIHIYPPPVVAFSCENRDRVHSRVENPLPREHQQQQQQKKKKQRERRRVWQGSERGGPAVVRVGEGALCLFVRHESEAWRTNKAREASPSPLALARRTTHLAFCPKGTTSQNQRRNKKDETGNSPPPKNTTTTKTHFCF